MTPTKAVTHHIRVEWNRVYARHICTCGDEGGWTQGLNTYETRCLAEASGKRHVIRERNAQVAA